MYTVICHHSLPIPPNLLLVDHHHRKRTRRICSRKCFEEIENSGLLFLMWAHCVFPVKRKRRFWCAMRSAGAWNLEVLENWEAMGRNWNVEDWEDEQYQNLLRMTKLAFWRLHASIGHHLRRKRTNYRVPIPSHQRLAVTIYWLSHGLSFYSIALLFGIGKSTVVEIVHDAISVMKVYLVPKVCKFPTGRKLRKTMSQFKTLCGLPRCAGAIDGTFMKILKPTCDFSDAYWCYKKFPAIILLATCDANGVFTFVDAGRAGSLGDAATFQASTLCNKIDNDEWLKIAERAPGRNEISGTYIRPYRTWSEMQLSVSPPL